MGGEELEFLCAAAAGARYSEPIKNQDRGAESDGGESISERFTSVIKPTPGPAYYPGRLCGLWV